MNEILLSLPLWIAKFGAILLFSGILSLVWLLPRRYVYDSRDGVESHWKDLRLWATLLLLIQLLLYWIF